MSTTNTKKGVKRALGEGQGDILTSVAKKKDGDVTLDDATLHDLLEHKAKHHPEFKGSVFVLQHDDTVLHALTELAKQHISAAPVTLASSCEDTDAGNYLGTIDAMSLLQYIVSTARDSEAKADEDKDKSAKDKAKGAKHAYLGDAAATFLKTKLIVVCGSDSGFSFAGESLSQTLREALASGFMDNGRGVLHRILVSDPRGLPLAIVTQSDVVDFVHHHPGCAGALMDKTLEELELVQGEVVTVDQNLAAIEALELMADNNISSVGVVNAEGALVGNLSASDLKGMSWEDMQLLSLPVARFLMVEDFLKHEKEFTSVEKARAQRMKKLRVVAVHKTATFRQTLADLVRARVHRVYVVDKARKPTGIVTLTDVLQALL